MAAFKPGCFCREGLENIWTRISAAPSLVSLLCRQPPPLSTLRDDPRGLLNVKEPPRKAHRSSLLEKQAVRVRGRLGGRLLDLADLGIEPPEAQQLSDA